MDEIDKESEPIKPHWFIDLDWCEKNNRSFLAIAYSSLCARCRKELMEGQFSLKELFQKIKYCCSSEPDFITERVPMLTSIFKLFLTNNNQPLNVVELGEQLRQWRGGDNYRTSEGILTRLLESDQYYGLRPVSD
jgi:hypothetical protein